MKTKIIFRMFSGIFIGILGTLLLTLNYWGNSFWQVAIAITCGVLLGMFITDTKLSIQILKNTCILTWRFFVYFYEGITSIKINLRKVSRETWIRRYLRISLCLKVVIMVSLFIIFFSDIILNETMFEKLGFFVGILFLYSFIPLFTYLIALVTGLGIGFTPKISKRLWEREKISYLAYIVEDEKGYISFDTLFKITQEKGIWFIEKKSFLAFFYIFLEIITWTAICIKKILLFGGYCCIAFVVSVLLSIFFFPFWFFRELWKQKKMFIVVLSIIAGGITGTIYESYLIGMLTGFSIAGSAIFMERFFRETNLFFYWKGLFHEDNLIWDKLNEF
jgi:hypothetical protein